VADQQAKDSSMPRREVLKHSLRGALVLGVGGVAGALSGPRRREGAVWQLDPARCTQCGRCETHCVLKPSAVKCFHTYAMCGYCKLCFGYFRPAANALNAGAENQLCPTGAIRRRYVEDPYHEYTVEEDLCTGCAICVKGCNTFGNGSLFLQVDHSLCVGCNECAIAKACPAEAFRRVPLETPYLLKGREGEA
jgi:Na+-translocating ferredoxin:NAD+ oxidoreductase subunit B